MRPNAVRFNEKKNTLDRKMLELPQLFVIVSCHQSVCVSMFGVVDQENSLLLAVYLRKSLVKLVQNTW